MRGYNLSGAASNDIAGLYKFGIKNFGLDQARTYILALESFFKELAERPELAKDASSFAHNLKYYSYKAHVIFYVIDNPNHIFVIRVLGKRMDFIQHL